MLESILGATAASVLGTVGTVAGSIAGIGPVREWLDGCRTRLIAGRLTPGNHDLVKGIRTAHLCALDHVARRYTKLLIELPAQEIGPDDHAFATNLRVFIDARLKPLSDKSIDHGVLTIDDINHVLDQVAHAAIHESFAALSHKAKEDCETRALYELARDAGRNAPALFERVFKGELSDADTASWYEAFSLYVTEELKTNERFRSIFFATELVDIRRALDEVVHVKLKDFPDLSGFMDDVKHRLKRIEQGLDEVRAQLDKLQKNSVTTEAPLPPAQSSAPLPSQTDKEKRSFNLSNRQKLLALLNERISGKGHIKISVYEKREVEIAKQASDVFNLAGWNIQYYGTVQDAVQKGVKVVGSNSLFVDSVTSCLRDCGISDAYSEIQPTEIPRDHVKWEMVQTYVRIHFGYQ